MDTGSKNNNRSDSSGKPIKEDNIEKLSKDEIGAIIQCKKILKKIGHGSDINIQEICDEIGVSRKTAYSYGTNSTKREKDNSPAASIPVLESENQVLKKRLKKAELENKGLRIAKMIVDDFKKKGLV